MANSARRIRLHIWLLAITALTLAGCAASPAGAPATASPAPRPTPQTTTAPTPTPTTSWLPQPQTTPGASPSPSFAADAKTTKLSAFRRHMFKTYDAMKPIFRRLSRDATAHDLAAVAADVDDALKWASTESEWLALHRPRNCYADAYEAWRSVVDQWSGALTLLAASLDPPIVLDIARAVGLMYQANETFSSYVSTAQTPICH